MVNFKSDQRMISLGLTLLQMRQNEGLTKDLDTIGAMLKRYLKEYKQKLFICGNGGSYSQALHFSAEFARQYPVTCLMSNAASMTAIANDIDYNEVFAQQILVEASRDDVLIALTTSGQSSNVINAMRQAIRKGLTVVLLTGDSPHSEAIRNCHWQIRVPTKSTPLIQEVHLNILHTWMEMIQED